MLSRLIKSIDDLDIKILRYLVVNAKKGREYVSYEGILNRINAPQKVLDRALSKLTRLKILARHLSNQEYYRITFKGLNTYAAYLLIKKGVVRDILERIGVGKESEVYLAKNSDNELIAVKFHRIGITSFKRAALLRDYGVDFQRYGWIYRSIISAEREYIALKELYPLECKVPKAYGYAVNAVATEYIEGIELYRLRNLQDPYSVLLDIISTIKKAYNDADIVHGDLSEYNIMVAFKDRETGYIIDWPQWVYKDHESAQNLLKRDVEYIIKFFRRRFNIKVNFTYAYQYIIGVIDSFEEVKGS